MQLVKLRTRLKKIRELIDSGMYVDGGVSLPEGRTEELLKALDEAVECAEKIGLGYHAIVEVLNRI